MSEQIKRIGIIGGSGLGQALIDDMEGRPNDFATPFGPHAGPIITGEYEGVPIAFLPRHGAGHVYSPSQVPYRANIYALKQLGVTHVIASGACGSLAESIKPRELVVADQVIDKTFRRDSTFFDQDLVVHVDFAYPFCQQLRQLLLKQADKVESPVHDHGTYVCMEGPQFSSRAESLMHQQWGGHLIGMTCLPEAKLAREAEMCYALVGLATDYDCWREHQGDVDKHLLIKEIIHNLQVATTNAITLIRAAVAAAGPLLNQSCEHHHALESAIWSDKSVVTPDVRRHFGLLIEKYFKG